eukprot:918650-Alexandrium_andersonii.AAC.1
MVRWIAPYRTPLSWLHSKPGARRTTEGRPCAEIGLQLFLGPLQDRPHLGGTTEQERPCPVLPQA